MATRAYLRREIGEIVGSVDAVLCTGTGSTTTAVDALNLGGIENNAWVGRYGWVAVSGGAGSEANLYSTVRVTGNTKSSNLVTFTPALSASTIANDVIEFYNRHGQGPRIDQIHRAINRVLESVANNGLTEVVSSTSTYDADSPTIAVTSGWRRVVAVEWQDDEEEWHEVPPADVYVDRVARTVRLENYARALADTQTVRLRGYTAASTTLSSDTSSTVVDTEFLINEAASQLLLAFSEEYRDPAAARAKAQYHRQIADSRRPKVLRPVLSRGWVFA